jgi:predicted transposase/invertase (TIGR01784 family)
VSSQPHDTIFKAAFEHPAHAAGLFRDLLPNSLTDALDWDTLALEPGSFVDPSLIKSHSDLLFSAQLDGQKLLLYVLLEHQSRVDRRMTFRVLRYLTRIWDRHLEQVGEPLPLIIAIIVSHAPGGWTAPTRFHDLISPTPASIEGVQALVPSFEILVEDLAHLSNEDLQDLALAAFPKLVLWALRDARDAEQLERNLDDWATTFAEALTAPSGIEAVSLVFRYIAFVCEGLHFDEFRAKLREQLPETERPAMTMAEELMQKGRAEGRAEGRVEGQITLIVKQLTRKFGDLPAEYRARLETATTDLLERYAERLIGAGTLAAVFADD